MTLAPDAERIGCAVLARSQVAIDDAWLRMLNGLIMPYWFAPKLLWMPPGSGCQTDSVCLTGLFPSCYGSTGYCCNLLNVGLGSVCVFCLWPVDCMQTVCGWSVGWWFVPCICYCLLEALLFRRVFVLLRNLNTTYRQEPCLKRPGALGAPGEI